MSPAISGEAIILPLAVSSTNKRAGNAASDKQPLMRLVQRHGEAGSGGRCRPTGEDRALHNVSDLDLLCVRAVH